MFNFMTDVWSARHAVRVDGGEMHPRLNQSDRYQIRRGSRSSLREKLPHQPPWETAGQRVVRGDTGGRSRRSCDRWPQLLLHLSGPVPFLSPLTTGRINGPFKRAQGPSNKDWCGVKPSHPEPHSLRPQPINPNIIRNAGIHSRNSFCSVSWLPVHSRGLCLIPETRTALTKVAGLVYFAHVYEVTMKDPQNSSNKHWPMERSNSPQLASPLNCEPLKFMSSSSLKKRSSFGALVQWPTFPCDTKITFVSIPGETRNNNRKLPAT